MNPPITFSDNARLEHVLAKHPLFEALPEQAISTLANLFTHTTYAPQDIVVREGELVDAIYFILDGQAEVKTDHPIALLHAGDNIGLSTQGIFSITGERTATVMALTLLKVARIHVEPLHHFFESYPTLHPIAHLPLLIRMNFVKQVFPFFQTDIDTLRKVANQIEEKHLSTEEVLFRQNDPGDACYLIQSGEIRLSITLPTGEEKILAHLSNMQVFGETALLLHTTRNATAVAQTNTTLLVFPQSLLLEMIDTFKEASQLFHHLQLERNRPIQQTGVEVYETIQTDGQKIVTLKQLQTNDYFQLSEPGLFIWRQMDGTRSIKEIMRTFYQSFGPIDTKLFYTLIFDLKEGHFIRFDTLEEKAHTEHAPYWMKLFARLRKIAEHEKVFSNIDQWIDHTYHHFLWIFYTKTAKKLLALLAIIGLACFIKDFHVATHAFNQASHKWMLFIISSYATIPILLLKELAQAYAAKSEGRKVNSFMLGWFWIGPTASCDTTDMWLCPNKKSRLFVDLAGVYLLFIIAGLSVLLTQLPLSGPIKIIGWFFAYFTYLAAFSNLNPIFEFSGYFTLMDLLNKPNLREMAFLALNPRKLGTFSLKNNKEIAIYWAICFIYKLLEFLLPYLSFHFILYTLFGPHTPWIGLATAILTLIFTSIVIYKRFFKSKQLIIEYTEHTKPD